MAAIGWNALASGATAGGDAMPATAPPYAVGRALSVDAGAQVMQPVHMPAQVGLLAARPGAAGVAAQELWAAGISTAASTQPGWATGPGGQRLSLQSVFLHHDRGGWQVTGAPVRQDGVTAMPVVITSLSVAADGDGWAVGQDDNHVTPYEFVLLRHDASASGPAWVYDAASSAQLGAVAGSASRDVGTIEHVRVSVGSAGDSTYGYLGLIGDHGGAIMDLTAQGWQADSTGGPNGEVSGNLADVAAVDATHAWAGGSAYQVALQQCASETAGAFPAQGPAVPPPQCQRRAAAVLSQDPGSVLYHRTAAGWQSLSQQSLPAIAQGGSETTLQPDGAGGAWVAGVSNPQSVRLPVSAQQSAPSGPPFLMHVDAGGGADPATYCSGGACPGSLPLGQGLLDSIAVAPASGGGAGDLFVASADPSGLYRLASASPTTAGAFQAEPITVGPITSMAFLSPAEGWAASTTAAGIAPVLGHWTTQPSRPQARAWPSPVQAQLTSIAADPGGSGRLMAAARDGVWQLDPATGLWSRLAASAEPLRSISWPSPGHAWAAGGHTLLEYGGGSWHTVAIQGALDGDLESVAVLPRPLSGVEPMSAEAAGGAGGVLLPNAASAAGGGGGSLVAWGGDFAGEVGDGASNVWGRQPAAIGGVPGGVVQVSGGGDAIGAGFSLAVACPCHAAPSGSPVQGRRAGTVYTWGASGTGQLGRTGPATTPQPLDAAAAGMPPVVAVAAGTNHALALDEDGHLWAWGADDQGQLGDGDAAGLAQPAPVAVRTSPGQAFTAIAAGPASSLAIATDGTVWAWGVDDGTSLLTGVSSHSAAPVEVAGLSGAEAIASGGDFGLAAVACQPGSAQPGSPSCNAGQTLVYAWGNAAEPLGTSCSQTGVGTCPPLPVSGWPSGVQGQPVSSLAVVAGGPNKSTVLAVAGSGVYAWGAVLGSSTGIPTTSPAAVPGLPGGMLAVAGGFTQTNGGFALALSAAGDVYGWGHDRYGQIGQSSVDSSTVPMRIPGFSATAIGAGADQGLVAAANVTLGSGGGTPVPLPGSPGPTGASGPLQGYAVGDGGTAVRFDGHRWTVVPAPTGRRLLAVAGSPRDFVAVGDDGTILVDGGAGWTAAPPPPQASDPSGLCGDWYQLDAVTALPDGTVLIGGIHSTLLERDPAGGALSFHSSAAAPEGAVHALSARRDAAGRLHLLAAVAPVGSPTEDAFEDLCTAHPQDFAGWLMASDGGAWHDTQLDGASVDNTAFAAGPPANAASDSELEDVAVQRDQVQAVLLDASGVAGWAVGDHGATWRVDTGARGPSASPMESSTVVMPDASALLSFASLSDTGCLEGTCAQQLGWGSRGDVIAIEALRAIDAAARHGGVSFVAGGGDLRRSGSAQGDLDAMRALFDSVAVPVYEAVGARDLDAAGAGGTASSLNWQGTFGDRPAPWGHGAAPPGVTPVLSGGGAGSCSDDGRAGLACAATHYAFLSRRGVASLLVVVMDTAQTPLSANAENPSEVQATWLQSVLQQSPGVPAVIVMNKPVLGTGATTADGVSLSAVLSAATATPSIAVLSTAVPAQHVSLLPHAGAWFAAGGGGHLEGETVVGAPAAQDAAHGWYFAWQLISVVPDAHGALSLHVRNIPVLGDVALQAPQGTAARQGAAIAFTGLGRYPDHGGFQAYSPSDAPAFTPPPIGFPVHPASSAVSVPDYAFSSDDDSILVPVREDPAHPGHPLKPDRVHTVYDASSGLFCALRPGTTTVRLTAGTAVARVPVSVSGASGGECGPPVALPKPAAPALLPAVQPGPPHPVPPGPAQVPAPPPLHVRPQAPDVVVGVPLPPPAGVVPAPPGGMGQGAGQKEKEEESEAATEDARMTALLPRRDGPDGSWLPLGAAAVGTVLAGYCIARGRRRRLRPVRAAVVTAPCGQTWR